MLFFCKWEDRASLLVDDETKEKAIEVAAEVAGTPPVTIQPLPPRFFVAEVFFESEDDDADPADVDPDGEELIVQPLEHVDEKLAELHDAETPAVLAQAPTEPAPAVVEGDGVCTSEAEDDSGAIVSCSRKVKHDPPHRGTNAAGEELVWE
jgi:hypothetical protein